MRTVEFTDVQLQTTLSAVRALRNEHEDAIKVLTSKGRRSTVEQSALQFHRAESRALTSAMVSIYAALGD